MSNNTKNTWLTLAELVAYDPLKRSPVTFREYVRDKKIPHYRIKKNGKLFFVKEQIDEWLETFKVETE